MFILMWIVNGEVRRSQMLLPTSPLFSGSVPAKPAHYPKRRNLGGLAAL
jgi:hypothetical protein